MKIIHTGRLSRRVLRLLAPKLEQYFGEVGFVSDISLKHTIEL